MSKFRFVLPAVALSIAFLSSCSKMEDEMQKREEEVQKNQCASNQGEWDESAKMCVKCPSGTSMSEGQCVAATPPTTVVLEDGTTITICPARTKLNEKGVCVADIIEVDPNAAAGKYYCDWGKLDPLAVDTHDECYEIEYQSECDNEWGRLVNSCNDNDRRKDFIYCDFGPGECYWVLKASDCDTDWGVVANKCGTHGKYPNGTVCPNGQSKRQVEGINYCTEGEPGLTDGTATHCDWGAPHIENGEVQGDCWPINDAETRLNCLKWGKGVKTCPVYSCPAGTSRPTPVAACEISGSVINPSSSSVVTTTKYCYYGKATECWPINGYGDVKTEADCEAVYGQVVEDCNNVVLKYCDWGQPVLVDGKVDKGCFSIRSEKDLQDCQYGKILDSCPNYTCPAGTKKMDDFGWGISACEL